MVVTSGIKIKKCRSKWKKGVTAFGLEMFEVIIRDLLDSYYVDDLAKKVPKLTDIVTFSLIFTVHVDSKNKSLGERGRALVM